MIRVMLKGRLGNNLFQYAVGRSLAYHLGVPLVLDASKLREKVWKDSSSLARLPIQATFLRKLPFTDRLIRKLDRNRLTLRRMNVIREGDNESFNPSVTAAPDDSLLIGYFQSPLYFRRIESQLRKEIDPSDLPWPAETADYAAELSSTESVAVHVRRTDYLGSSEWNVCTLAYYEAAIDRLRNTLGQPSFHIFSDDPAWCRNRFTAPDQRIVDFPSHASDPLHDLHLMGRARHHIIANSSYSWWGAWLCRNPAQRVICPSKWTNGASRFTISEKLYDHWETLPVSPEDQGILPTHQ